MRGTGANWSVGCTAIFSPPRMRYHTSVDVAACQFVVDACILVEMLAPAPHLWVIDRIMRLPGASRASFLNWSGNDL